VADPQPPAGHRNAILGGRDEDGIILLVFIAALVAFA